MTSVSFGDDGQIIGSLVAFIRQPVGQDLCREAFLKNMQTLEEKDEMIRTCSNLQVEREVDRWSISLDTRTDAGTELVLWMEIEGNSIREFCAFLKRRDSIRLMEFEQDPETEGKMYEVLYRTPSVNKTVMETLYEDTGYDWRMLFAY